MKKLLNSIFVLVIIISLNSISNSQDNSNLSEQDRIKLNTPYVPDLTPRAPVNNNNSILFLSNCPPQDRPTCLKEPFDSGGVGWTIVPFALGVPPGYRNDDGSSPSIPIPFVFNLYGSTYTSVFINNNGNLTFTAASGTFTPTAFPSTIARVAPFFADVDTRPLVSGVVYYKITPTRLTVVWDSVGYYNQQVDKRNTFQCIISNGNDSLLGIGNNVCFSYGDMAWTTGSASGGIGGFGGTAATVGVNKGDNVNFATLGRFNRPGSYYGGPGVDTNGVSYLDCKTFCFDADSTVGNICPIAGGFPTGDVIVDPGPYVATYSMFAPEVGQITTGSVSGVPAGMTVTITNGLTLTFDVTFLPPCPMLGTFSANVCFTGIDNATVPCTTTVCVTFRWDCPLPVEMSSFSSSVTERNVLLEWTTSTELNNARFEVERSVNNNWVKIGSVEGSGTTSSPINYSYFDRGLNSGNYNYRLKQIDFNGNSEYFNLSNEVVIGIPNSFELVQNYPNPFNPSTRIEYSIPYEGKVRLTIYDAMGKEVSKLVDNNQPAGYYSVDFNASNFSSGIYYYRIEVSGQNNFVDSKKMLLIK